MTLHDSTWQSMTCHDIAWHYMTYHGIAWYYMTWHDMTSHDIAWHSMILHGMTWHAGWHIIFRGGWNFAPTGCEAPFKARVWELGFACTVVARMLLVHIQGMFMIRLSLMVWHVHNTRLSAHDHSLFIIRDSWFDIHGLSFMVWHVHSCPWCSDYSKALTAWHVHDNNMFMRPWHQIFHPSVMRLPKKRPGASQPCIDMLKLKLKLLTCWHHHVYIAILPWGIILSCCHGLNMLS